MRKLIIFTIILMSGTWLQAQDTTKWFYRDTLIYSSVVVGDTTFHYKEPAHFLYYKVYEKGNEYASFRLEGDKWQAVFKKVIIKGMAIDGQCHGVKADGTRCTRKVTGLYCWQHKK